MEWIILLVFLIIIIAFIGMHVKIVNQSESYVIERLGTYRVTWSTGLHFLVPFIERIAKKISLKEHVVDFPPQPVITKDNVTMQIDTVVYFQVTDSKLYAYGVNNPMMAVENLTATTLRNLIGDLDLDATLTSRDVINTQMRAILDEATDKWGIKVNRVEVKNILPPREIQDAMEKQMKAERERREAILQAEGKKKSQILIAEGEKESVILQAEAAKERQIREAEGRQKAMVLEAEGQAKAILEVQKATADGLSFISQAEVNEGTVKIKELEALAKVANGKSTKLIIPSEIQSLTGLAASLKEAVSIDKVEDKEAK
ncbi:regulator of protease activity HflC (stomatin/prohibitin superfamily) [Breznakia sp. PF5-3]|uniref:SPFH domain-containing protein n=1 Tax=unclassified Breznakia TaxID=2623764 RepID=UPI002404E38F|nr:MULTISPECIES: SPFH domain-containing protein [unclassified Breznakia]MDL2276436.1 SPFH/Band 7/PHB domain protein [Breznakia sp. OttesenSCG-928-G09]MDF9825579.1 regulator of protease activity HflC (stomatin/prohibitin superfamily) [Breznakia sp. PM6-1]MDF9836430.1 regulator of protease activity HflC (stomatin/prohibitin superfamily) [Breznakia sp. PF5-3]MDF9838562.1 regulator of protease activity HflC (stomatin/prohibitin superfamily) [Breznakia sp. PFB2-8]MDF9860591.1 regulator of protease 